MPVVTANHFRDVQARTYPHISRRWRVSSALLGLMLISGMGGTLLVTACADELTISHPPGQNVQLRLEGVASKDYVIQKTGDLVAGRWTTLGMGVTDTAGVFQTSDATAKASAGFYRGARLPWLQTTTSTAATVPNNTVMVILAGSDPLNPGGMLTAIITQLPSQGSLQQMDGTPITAVGTVVTDAQNRVKFVPAANLGTPMGGSANTSFSYELRRASNGVTSLPQTVAVSLEPNWVFSSFDDATQKLQLAYSLDGIHWSQTGDLYTAPGSNGVRDSSIVKINGVYYIAYTAGDFGLAAYVQICSSVDLVHWTYLCDIDTTAPGTVNFSWAPEWFVDGDGSIYLYITRETDDGSWRIFWTRPTSADLTAWTPLQRIGGELAGRGAIDAQVVRDGNLYRLLYRNCGPAGGTDCVEMAKGTSPVSFDLDKTGDWAGWGTPREGPCLVPLGGSHWRLYYVLAGDSPALDGSRVAYSESSDGLATWTTPVGTNVPQHGTCLALRKEAASPATGPVATPATLKSPSTGGARWPNRGNRMF